MQCVYYLYLKKKISIGIIIIICIWPDDSLNTFKLIIIYNNKYNTQLLK